MAHRFTSDPAEVSARMRLIRSKDTKPELTLFSFLAEARIRFEPHARIGGVTVDARVGRRLLIFVDSPFWHLREREELRRLSTYWRQRLLANRSRDRRQSRRLRLQGFTVLRLWADRLKRVEVIRRIQCARVKASQGRRPRA